MWLLAGATVLRAIPGHILGCAALAFILCLAQPSDAAARACEESGYCSVGLSKHWVGDISTGAQLRSMLEAVTYKKELILSIFMLNERNQLWADQALQLHSELQSHGYGHFLFVANNKESCAQLNTYGNISCVWDGSELPHWVLDNEPALWHYRWKLLVRAARLGYNVMSLDTDFIFFRDPYYHLKRKPFTKYQLLGSPESHTNVFHMNGGFMYAHNARPDGPVTWVFKQVVMSTLRRGDDHFKYLSQWFGSDRNCLFDDQAMIFDALSQAAVGHPAMQAAAYQECKRRANKNVTTRAGNTLTPDQLHRNIHESVHSWQRTGHIERTVHIEVRGLFATTRTNEATLIQPSAEHLKATGFRQLPKTDCSARVANITVPNLNLGYPEELGGRYASEQKGNLSSAFIAQLKDDCPDCPWWPERRPVPDPDPLPQLLGPNYDSPGFEWNQSKSFMYHDPSIAPESIMQVPPWLMSSLGLTRRGWILGLKSPMQGPSVMGHVHSWHMQTHRAHKIMIRKIYGRYNWTLGAHVARVAGLQSPYAIHKDITRVLALSPRVDLSRTRSWEEYATMVTGLMQVAFLSHRVLLLPDLPCETAWFHDPQILKDSNSEDYKRLCIAPMFWQHRDRFPLPVPYAVDQQGKLIGGWARRLRQLYSQVFSSVPAHEQPAVAPLILDVPTGYAEQSGMQTGSTQHTQRRRRLGRSLRQASADTAAAGADAADGFWERQRYRVIIPGVWDPSCTRDMHAMVPPEFAHWLKHTDAGRAAKTQPGTDNVIFRAAPNAEALSLRPPLAPGGDSSAVPIGSVVKRSDDKGWSWYDVMAKVSVSDVYAYVNSFASQPLLFVDHPVMITHNATDAAADAEWTRKDLNMTKGVMPQVLSLRERRHGRMVIPDEALSAVNHHIRHGRCKANWVMPETHHGTMVNMTHGVPCRVEKGVLHAA